MTVEKCREILKVHILAADQHGKKESAWSLMEALTAIDDERSRDLKNGESV